MGFFSIFEFLAGLMKAIPFFDKWFSKTRGDKEKKEQKEIKSARDLVDSFKETGRPPK